MKYALLKHIKIIFMQLFCIIISYNDSLEAVYNKNTESYLVKNIIDPLFPSPMQETTKQGGSATYQTQTESGSATITVKEPTQEELAKLPEEEKNKIIAAIEPFLVFLKQKYHLIPDNITSYQRSYKIILHIKESVNGKITTQQLRVLSEGQDYFFPAMALIQFYRNHKTTLEKMPLTNKNPLQKPFDNYAQLWKQAWRIDFSTITPENKQQALASVAKILNIKPENITSYHLKVYMSISLKDIVNNRYKNNYVASFNLFDQDILPLLKTSDQK